MVFYLAMTAAEIQRSTPLPQKLAYMACHFSPYSTGLSNLPDFLPEGSILILNDRTPIAGHDPDCIVRQLAQLVDDTRAASILLDFQRPDCPETANLVKALAGKLPCPVAVSQSYAAEGFPVFLPPIPPDVPWEEALAPWNGWEIWLDAAPGHMCITVTAQGAADTPADCPADGLWQAHADLCCHYLIQLGSDWARFFIHRTEEDIHHLLEKTRHLGVTTAIGLYQEWSSALEADRLSCADADQL